ncbi:hypothetical protein SDRG_07040 [Saprolegnia diclina VS20]|uniref:CCHC-type domain-containing protein n=1 Tax=Saprolegnia diclina (strain VS20) TaxID=1156394 RepID=T0QBP4_SAPDV|nr:hypothetical protein SDRG_07040 [Saprolegnia diclina VS20]EQC35329.1 hypothetical protein SDRG_07040 [Saprolegnia diclina VS20]|eukprot:XP_008611079.1 hypothetical protein SDRG_07040 [Saprolegnia diclina VS20]
MPVESDPAQTVTWVNEFNQLGKDDKESAAGRRLLENVWQGTDAAADHAFRLLLKKLCPAGEDGKKEETIIPSPKMLEDYTSRAALTTAMLIADSWVAAADKPSQQDTYEEFYTRADMYVASFVGPPAGPPALGLLETTLLPNALSRFLNGRTKFSDWGVTTKLIMGLHGPTLEEDPEDDEDSLFSINNEPDEARVEKGVRVLLRRGSKHLTSPYVSAAAVDMARIEARMAESQLKMELRLEAAQRKREDELRKEIRAERQNDQDHRMIDAVSQEQRIADLTIKTNDILINAQSKPTPEAKEQHRSLKIPKFDSSKEGTAGDFIRGVEGAAEVTSQLPTAKLVVLYRSLGQREFSWTTRYVGNHGWTASKLTDANWKELRAAFIEQYSGALVTRIMQYENVQQRKAPAGGLEPMRSYLDRVQMLALEAGQGSNENSVVMRALMGMMDNATRTALSTQVNSAMTWESFVRVATQAADVIHMKSRRAPAMVQAVEEDPDEQDPSEVMAVGDGKKTWKCNLCGVPGHFRAQCPQNDDNPGTGCLLHGPNVLHTTDQCNHMKSMAKKMQMARKAALAQQQAPQDAVPAATETDAPPADFQSDQP